ncbi:MAG: fluoride efflux transporter CrcB [Herpetosiphon sp.]
MLGGGGLLGGLCRYYAARIGQGIVVGGVPLATFAINASGCLLLGLVIGTVTKHPYGPAQQLSLLFGTGFCGAYTTFSSFGYETVALWRQRRRWAAVMNGIGQPILGTVLAWVGMLLGGHFA